MRIPVLLRVPFNHINWEIFCQLHRSCVNISLFRVCMCVCGTSSSQTTIPREFFLKVPNTLKHPRQSLRQDDVSTTATAPDQDGVESHMSRSRITQILNILCIVRSVNSREMTGRKGKQDEYCSVTPFYLIRSQLPCASDTNNSHRSLPTVVLTTLKRTTGAVFSSLI